MTTVDDIYSYLGHMRLPNLDFSETIYSILISPLHNGRRLPIPLRSKVCVLHIVYATVILVNPILLIYRWFKTGHQHLKLVTNINRLNIRHQYQSSPWQSFPILPQPQMTFNRKKSKYKYIKTHTYIQNLKNIVGILTNSLANDGLKVDKAP